MILEVLEVISLQIYALALAFIFFYSLTQGHLVLLYKRAKRKATEAAPEPPEELPMVTVQLPVFNEFYVVERLIKAVIEFDYPKHKLEIQVLDDSTDETVDIVKKQTDKYAAKGFQIVQIRRERRTGYKAGALAEGLKVAKGEFIALFDADFIPCPDFLMQTIPYFVDQKIGMVQTKWEHINRDYSMLTRLQAFGLDAHFSIEQSGRNEGNYFLNFNGTAGIWRRRCIEESGGWHFDTLTEDLDLSYRAQLKGWKFKYLENVGSPAELPAAMGGLKAQQFRWTKGGAETAKKMLGLVFSSSIPWRHKVHAAFHLMNSTVFVCILVTALLSVPILFIKKFSPEYVAFFNLAPLLLVSLMIIGSVYWTSLHQKVGHWGKTWWQFLKTFPLFLSVSMGLSLHNTIAVIEGYLGIKTPFVRTPKFNLVNRSDSWTGKKYSSQPISLLTTFEGLLAIYFMGAIGAAFYLNDFGLLPFHLMLLTGYSIIVFHSIRKPSA